MKVVAISVIDSREIDPCWKWPLDQTASRVQWRMCNIERIPHSDDIVHDGQIAVLDLSLNSLSTISSRIAAFSSLRVLNLSQNLLRTISMKGLPSLVDLDLGRNLLTTIEMLHLPSLLRLNLAGNSLSDFLANLDLPVLTSLDLTSNTITTMDGIRRLANLNILIAEHNLIDDLSPIMPLSSLTVARFACNRLASLTNVRQVLLCMKSLTALSFWGNPIASDPIYRLTILEAVSADLLDEQTVGRSTRERFAKMATDEAITDLISAITKEFGACVESEESLAEEYIADIRRLEREAETGLAAYRDMINQELRETISYLQMARSRQGWAVGREALVEWRRQVEQMEADRGKAVEDQRKRRQEQDKRRREKAIATRHIDQKLYTISLRKPGIWRAMKARELELQQQEQGCGVGEVVAQMDLLPKNTTGTGGNIDGAVDGHKLIDEYVNRVLHQ